LSSLLPQLFQIEGGEIYDEEKNISCSNDYRACLAGEFHPTFSTEQWTGQR
jgi:hypothetical protein